MLDNFQFDHFDYDVDGETLHGPSVGSEMAGVFGLAKGLSALGTMVGGPVGGIIGGGIGLAFATAVVIENKMLDD